MNTYKLGNKIKCIIRSFSPATIGDTTLTYGNQPYTILKDVSATLNFTSKTKTSKSVLSEVIYNRDFVNEIKLSNVLITDKILNLIYSKNEVKLCNTLGNFESDNKKHIYLSLNTDKIYQVFIYNESGELESAYGELSTSSPITVQNAESSYLICYSYMGTKSVCLDREENICVSLDLEIIGNEDDLTNTMWIHLDKCILTSDKNLYFTDTTNTIDLTFKVLDSDNPNYITFK